MKKGLVLCALVGVAVYATTAWSASSPTPTEQRLSKDIATLKTQMKSVQSQLKTAKTNLSAVEAVAGATILFSVCSDELATDALEGTWQVVDQISAALQAGKTYFGPQAPVAATLQGQDICSAGGVTRSQVLPPTVAGYQALLAQFHSASLKFAEAHDGSH